MKKHILIILLLCSIIVNLLSLQIFANKEVSNMIYAGDMAYNSDMNVAIIDSAQLSFNPSTKVLSNTNSIHVLAHGKLISIAAGTKDFSSHPFSGVTLFYVVNDFSTTSVVQFSNIQAANNPDFSTTKVIIVGAYFNGTFYSFARQTNETATVAEQSKNNAINSNSFLQSINYDRPLYKIGIVADSIFEHLAPTYNELPANCPNKYQSEGLIPNDEGIGHRPPMANTNNAYRMLYDKFKEYSQYPDSIHFKDFTQAVLTGIWSNVTYGNNTYKKSVTALSSAKFTIPAGYENVMVIYNRVPGYGKANIAIDGVVPPTIPGLTNNNKVRNWAVSGNDVAPVDLLDFAYANPGDAWCNGGVAQLCTEVYNGLETDTPHTLTITKENNIAPIEIWGICYWNGTFIYPVNRGHSGFEITDHKAYAYQEINVSEIDYVLAFGHSLNNYSSNITPENLIVYLNEYTEKMQSWGKPIAYISAIPFGKSYNTADEWSNHNGTNWQQYTFSPGTPETTEKQYIEVLQDYCNRNGIPYIPTYEAFKAKINNSNMPNLSDGECMGQIYQHDGQHLREKGSRVIVNAIWNSIGFPLMELKE